MQKQKWQNQLYSSRYSRQSEYDSADVERAGANTIVKVFKNMNANDIRESVDEFVKAIEQSQIIMFRGGFSAGWLNRTALQNSLRLHSAMRR